MLSEESRTINTAQYSVNFQTKEQRAKYTAQLDEYIKNKEWCNTKHSADGCPDLAVIFKRQSEIFIDFPKLGEQIVLPPPPIVLSADLSVDGEGNSLYVARSAVIPRKDSGVTFIDNFGSDDYSLFSERRLAKKRDELLRDTTRKDKSYECLTPGGLERAKDHPAFKPFTERAQEYHDLLQAISDSHWSDATAGRIIRFVERDARERTGTREEFIPAAELIISASCEIVSCDAFKTLGELEKRLMANLSVERSDALGKSLFETTHAYNRKKAVQMVKNHAYLSGNGSHIDWSAI